MISRRTRLLASTIFATTSLVAISGATAQTVSTAGGAAAPAIQSTAEGVAATAIQAAPAAAAAPAAPEITITGTRIRQPNLTSVSPLTVVNDQEIKLEGASNIENLMNALPQITAGQQSNVSNGSSGTATVDLRDLGPQRTLVLVDGKRLMPGDPQLPVADLNNIPSAMVERVEVVTGGASAVYGADAVAGVVNFIMKKNFQGAQIDAQSGWVQHKNDDGTDRDLTKSAGFTVAPSNYSTYSSTEVSAIIGMNAPDDKGNITAYATYRNLQAITQNNYDVSACTIAAARVSKNVLPGDSYIYDGHACIGSSNSAFGRFTLVNGSQNVKGVTTARLHVNTDGSQTFVTTGVPGFNFAPLNYFQRPEDRYTAGFNGHYTVNKNLEFYSDFMFADDHTVAQIAPSGLFAGGGPGGASFFQINCNNPLLSGTEKTQLCGVNANTAAVADVQAGFRFVGNNRQDDLRHTNYKFDIGARGEFMPGWSYDAYLQYGTSVFNEHYLNDASLSKIQNALVVDPATGKCTVDAANCVPLNIFQAGKLTPAMLSYVLTPGFKEGATTEQIASASITGDLGQYGWQSPMAHDGIGVALGTEYRREGLSLNVDNEFATGDLSGQGGPTLPDHGSFDVYEIFGEARVPLVQDRPFFKSLNLDVGYRYSDYNLAGGTNTYKIEGDWAINRDVRLRAGYNRAVRAPNVVELFLGSQVANVGASDPCAGQKVFTAGCVASFQQTASTLGISAATLAARFAGGGLGQCPAAQCSGLFSGNANLKPEQADTYTAGIVFTPTESWLRGFSATLDYYNIEVDNTISNPNAQIVLNECVNGNTSACNLVHRDPSSGVVFGNQGFVIDTTINGGFVKTQGWDVTANYRFRPTQWGMPDWGTLSIAMIGTYIEKFTTQPIAGGPAYDCAGLYGAICSTPLPHWKHRVRFTWDTPVWPVSLSLDWRYVGAVKFDANQGNQGAIDPKTGQFVANPTGNFLLAVHPSGITDTADEHIAGISYFDLSAQWKIRPNLNLRAGITNIFDKDPPVVDSGDIPASGPPTGNGNTYPGIWDSLGRTIFVGLTLDF